MSAPASPSRAGPFAPAVVIGLVLIGFLAFVAFAALSAFEPDFRNGDDGGAHALSKSAVGYSGLVVLLNAIGRPAVIARGSVGPAHNDGMMIVTIDQGDPRTPLRDLSTTRNFPGPEVLILPKWDTVPATHRGWVRKAGLRDVDADTWIGNGPHDLTPDQEKARPKIELAAQPGSTRHLLSYAAAGSASVQTQTGPIENFRTFKSAPGWEPVIVDETGGLVLVSADDGKVFALAEPDLLNNHGLADLTNAQAGLFVLHAVAPEGPVYFDVTLNGFERARSMLKLALQPPFVAATLCALAAVVLMMWHAIWRFGPPARGSREIAMGKQALADNQAGLIRMAGREPRMAGRYGSLMAGLAAAAVGAPAGLAGEALEAFLDRLGAGGRTRESFTDLSHAANAAATNGELMDVAARLHRWRLEMTREA